MANIDNAISSSFNPVIKTTIIRISRSGHGVSTAIASFGNGFALGVGGSGGGLGFDCINLGARVLPVGGGICRVFLRSTVILGAIRIGTGGGIRASNLTVPRHRISFTSRAVDTGRFRNLNLASISRTLRKHVTNLSVIVGSNGLNTKAAVHLHNTSAVDALAGSRPLVIIGNSI